MFCLLTFLTKGRKMWYNKQRSRIMEVGAMSYDRQGADILERVPARPEELPERERRPVPPTRTRQRPRRIRLSVVSLFLSVLALMISVIALKTALSANSKAEDLPDPPEDTPKEETVTFRFGDKLLTPLERMPLNPYDKDAFSTDEKGRILYEKDGVKAKTGIDVSTHQKEIDWEAVAGDGIAFAMLRLGRRGYTEGGLFMDETFEANLSGALDAGLEVGVYFFSQALTPEEAEEEADYVLQALDGRQITCPVTFDWEPVAEPDSRTNGADTALLTECAAAFCRRIAEGGCRPAVYFNRTQGYLHYDLRELLDYELWLAEYDTVPDFYYHFDIWQYSNTGSVAGIDGAVDLDLMF